MKCIEDFDDFLKNNSIEILNLIKKVSKIEDESNLTNGEKYLINKLFLKKSKEVNEINSKLPCEIIKINTNIDCNNQCGVCSIKLLLMYVEQLINEVKSYDKR